MLLRIGINTGPVVVGTVGNDLRVHFTAMGDTINLASRMEQIAEPGTIYITEDTFKLTEGLFWFEALGAKEVKGKDQPMNVYRVIAPNTRRTRFDVSAERGLTPFVGRERELELLLDGFERSKEGRGQAVSIISDAGVGKSRLLYEFRKAVINENITFLEGRCLPTVEMSHKGTFYAAEKYLLEGLINSQKASEVAAEIWAAWTLGHLYFEMGAYVKAEEYYKKTIKTLERSKIFPSSINALKTYLTWAGVRAGTEGQDADLSVLFGYYENNKLNFFKGMIARSIGDILMQVDDEHMADSEIWIKKAIEADKRNGTRWYLATDHALYAEWFKEKGDLSRAKEQLNRAIEIFRECGADGWVKKYEEELVSLS